MCLHLPCVSTNHVSPHTCTTSELVSRKASESPTLATRTSHPTSAATVAVVPDSCGGSTLCQQRAAFNSEDARAEVQHSQETSSAILEHVTMRMTMKGSVEGSHLAVGHKGSLSGCKRRRQGLWHRCSHRVNGIARRQCIRCHAELR